MTLKTIEDYEKAIAESDNRLAELEQKLNEAYAEQNAENNKRAKDLRKQLIRNNTLSKFLNQPTIVNANDGGNTLTFILPPDNALCMYTIKHITRDQAFEDNLKVLTTLVKLIKRLHYICQDNESFKGFRLQATYNLVSTWMTFKLDRENVALELKVDLDTCKSQGRLIIENNLDNTPTPSFYDLGDDDIKLRVDLTKPHEFKDPGYTKTIFSIPFDITVETLKDDLTNAISQLGNH